MVKFTWLNLAKKYVMSGDYEIFSNSLKSLYKSKLLPLEKMYNFHYFYSSQLEDCDFDAKPMIMLVGQYSTGKTTLIKNLLKSEFPGMRIGPEPTTDRFIAIMYGNSQRVVPGNVLVVDPKQQFRGLSKYGNSFLNKFQCSQIENEVLKNLSIVDTPGILSGENQRVNRGYDFVGVLRWFAERVDRVILLFDAHKLDISDEFRRCIEVLQGQEDKIRIILNKSDIVDQQQLMRVYGALMWSLGKIINTPEVVRVYIGSFWDQPLHCSSFKQLFEVEQRDLLEDLVSLPKNNTIRKLNDFIKRVRSAKVHAYIIGSLHSNMPIIFGREKMKKDLIANLDEIFCQIQSTFNISSGDLPDCSKMQEQLKTYNFSKLVSINKKMIQSVNEMLENDITKLMESINRENSDLQPIISGGVFEFVKDEGNPFNDYEREGINAGVGESEWIVNKQRDKYDFIFNILKTDDGKIPARIAKTEMNKSKLPSSVLTHIWKLSDVDNDGALDCDEFALAMYLIDVKLNGYDLPKLLPTHLLPPIFTGFFEMDELKMSVDKGILKIVFNRPRKKNAINRSMYDMIATALHAAADDDNIIMAVLTGEGDFYSSGNDIAGYLSMDEPDSSSSNFNKIYPLPGAKNDLLNATKMIKNFVSSFIDFPKILVAVVNGPAIGIAATTLALCDVVIASSKAYFVTPFTKLGLTAEGCSTLTFPRIMGPRKAVEMLYFNHKMTAKEAKEYNFVTDVIPHAELHNVWAKLHEYASLPHGSLLSVKSLVRGIDRKELHLANIAECRELKKRFESEEFLNGIQQFLTRSSKL